MQDPSFHPDSQESPFDLLAEALAVDGWGLFTQVIPPALARGLAARARSLENYRLARVGRHADRQLNKFVRRDEIAWITGRDATERSWLDWTESLRTHLNRTLLLGLTTFESHFAHYPPGTFYRRHLDAFKGESNRMVSVVVYLNSDWNPADGGELVLYTADDRELGRFPPTLGTLAIYLSEEFPHEVLPTSADRYSLAGWFRSRGDLPLENV